MPPVRLFFPINKRADWCHWDSLQTCIKKGAGDIRQTEIMLIILCLQKRSASAKLLHVLADHKRFVFPFFFCLRQSKAGTEREKKVGDKHMQMRKDALDHVRSQIWEVSIVCKIKAEKESSAGMQTWYLRGRLLIAHYKNSRVEKCVWKPRGNYNFFFVDFSLGCLG